MYLGKTILVNVGIWGKKIEIPIEDNGPSYFNDGPL